MKTFSVSAKLGVTFGVLIAILVAMGWMAMARMAAINADLGMLADHQWAKVQLSRRALAFSTANNRLTMQVFLMEDREAIEKVLAERAQNTENITGLVKIIEQGLGSERERALLDAVKVARAPYVESYKRALKMLLEEKKEIEAQQAMVQVTLPLLVKYHSAWNDFVQFQGEQMDLAAHVAAARYAKSRRNMYAAIGLAVLGALVIAVFVTVRTRREIAERQKAEEELRRAHAELDGRVQRRTAELSAANEALLRQSEEWMRTFDSITDLISVHDPQFRILRVNKAFAQTFGGAPESFVGRHCFEIVHATAEPFSLCPMRETMKARKAITREMFEPKLGLFLEVTVSPVLGEKGEVTELIHVVKNITERKRMEIDLAQARKLESVGQLAAGIAHEINTPTQFIGDNTRFLKESFGSVLGLVGRYRECQARASQSGTLNPAILADLEEVAVAADLDYLTGEIPKAIDQSLEGIERVSRIVRAMKDFSHPDETEKAETDINRALETTSIVSRNEWKYVAELETEFEANLPPAPCYAGQINQVFLNLIVNAAQAIAARVGSSGEKGVIRISTRRVEGGVEIRVSDTGTGIPEAVRPRMFEPFFTTKEVGKGTGQGLAMSRQIVVKGHGGTITFETETGKGTTFVVWLPGAAENAERGRRNAEGRSQEEQNQGLPGDK